MQTSWLTRSDHPACIIFFAGWGMDPAPFQTLAARECDVLMVYDYREIFMPPLQQLVPSGYQSLHLIAWSMGVWVSGLLFQAPNIFQTAVAINGTLTPIDDRRGISDRDFSTMLNRFDPPRLADFYRSMFDREDHYRRFAQHLPGRDPEGIRLELERLSQDFAHFGPGRDIFSSRLVGSRDRIFSGRNQVRSWGRDRCTVRKTGHFPFYHLQCWEDLLEAKQR